VQQASRFELVINLKTAKALNLTHPTGCSRHRRRGNRIGRILLHCRLSAAGTKRHFAAAHQTVAFGGIADIEKRVSAGPARMPVPTSGANKRQVLGGKSPPLHFLGDRFQVEAIWI